LGAGRFLRDCLGLLGDVEALVFGDRHRPLNLMARDRQVTQGICSRLLVPLEPLFPAAFSMELAGLEPATSWVRFMREASSPVAVVRHLWKASGPVGLAIATLRGTWPSLLDQNLTTALIPELKSRCRGERASRLDAHSPQSGREGEGRPFARQPRRRSRRRHEGSSPRQTRTYVRI